MATAEKWYFTKDQLANTPSRKHGFDADRELSYRQQAANFIQDMGQRLMVSQLCINTAIVYMHRFYVFHSLSHFHRNSIAAAAVFLAAKVEEQPRKLEHVIKVAYNCLHREGPALDLKSEQYLEQAQDLVFNENVLLQTLGFDVAIDHPHTHVVRCCQLVKASKDLAQTSYFMASNSLHLTTMCLQYKPTVVACFCIHLACKWSNWEIPQSNEGKSWFWYVDKTVTSELLCHLTGEFLHIFDKCPSRLKKKIMQQQNANQSPNMNHPSISNSPFDVEPRKVQSETSIDGSSSSFGFNRVDSENSKKINSSSGRQQHQDHREREHRKKELERQEREKQNSNAGPIDPSKHHSHHHKPGSSNPNFLKHTTSSSSGVKPNVHHNHHHSSRPDMKSLSQFMPQQRHSTSGNSSSATNSQSRDRQRMSRELHSHSHSADNSLDSSINNYSQESSTVHPLGKLSNNIHKSHNEVRNSKQPQKEIRPHMKNTDPLLSRTGSKKPDNLEQRKEEARIIINKPKAEKIKEEFASMMLKQSHHPSKYGHQPEKPQPPISSASALNVGQTAFKEKSPNAPVPASQVSHKSLSSSTKVNQTQPIKNGSSSSLGLINNMIDDPKIDKRQPSPIVQTPPIPTTKHRSLFSPEKTPTPARDSIHTMQRLKQKPKTSPAVSKAPDMSFTNSLPIISDITPNKQRLSNSMTSSTPLQKHRSSSSLEPAADHNIKPQQQQTDSYRKFLPNYGSQETQGLGNYMSDTNQMTKNSSISNKNISQQTSLNDNSKTLNNADSTMMPNNQRIKQQHQNLSNGLDTNLKQDNLTVDSLLMVKPGLPDGIFASEMPGDLIFGIKSEPEINDVLSFSEITTKNEKRIEPDLGIVKTERTDPLKSAQSISALLQENLEFPPMPSLLQPNSHNEQQQRTFTEESNPLLFHHQNPSEPSLPSTVDMSVLSSSNCSVGMPIPLSTTSTVILPSIPTDITAPGVPDDKKSEHKKSEKKKKKEKHKHKDKDKDKSSDKQHKRKHKEKDKDREKHHREKSSREKDNKTEESGGSSGYASSGLSQPQQSIKITIPKDKLNLTSETIGASPAASTPGSGLKIKIPKDRLKSTEVSSQPAILTQTPPVTPQAPLKIKIRTDALARGTGTESQASLQQDSRKRDRNEYLDNSMPLGAPPAKKHQQFQQQRPNDRQNGRPNNSYNSGSNNKVRGGGRVFPPYTHQHYAIGQPGYRGYHHQQRQSPPPSFVRHFRPHHPHHHPHNPYFPNFPTAIQSPVFALGYAGNMFDSMYSQYPQQQQFSMYPTGNMMMTTDGQIDTSMPPPPMGMAQVLAQTSEDNSKFVDNSVTSRPPPPPLPSGPPPNSSPPPPPPPE